MSEDEMQLIIDLHLRTERQGPGSKEETLRALEILNLNNQTELKVADIGSGCGSQTLVLAEALEGKITAVDLFDDFLSELNARAKSADLDSKIRTLQADMNSLPFKSESLDLIWSEGAIYSMGFHKGIKSWRPFLKEEGAIVLSEIVWLTDQRPLELEQYWLSQYSEMSSPDEKIKTMESEGYKVIDHFVLSANSWSKNYYAPLALTFPDFLADHKHSATAQAIVKEYETEIKTFERFKEFYSYGFFIARKA